MDLLTVILTQSLLFLPLAFGISISYYVLRATDMTVDGSFVLGAAIYARLVTLGFLPILAGIAAVIGGMLAGMLTAIIQRRGRIDALLAGVLATFILSSINLGLMGRPNISLLGLPSLVSAAFAHGDFWGWMAVAGFSLFLCAFAFFILRSGWGLTLRAMGDNPQLLQRLGKNIEICRCLGFALTNMMTAAAGCLTAQIMGYADIGMGFGMTLTGIGTIILGQQLLRRINKKPYFRAGLEFCACLIGVSFYFLALNTLVRLDINLVYLKMMIGILLVLFLRSTLPSFARPLP